ncbi:hypothetical protein Tco_0180412 [Tanacetum coccineum]
MHDLFRPATTAPPRKTNRRHEQAPLEVSRQPNSGSLMEQELRLKRKPAAMAFEAKAEKDAHNAVGGVDVLATSIKDLERRRRLMDQESKNN